jgi:hypothetical protein
MTGGLRSPTMENHWANFIKNPFFRQKAFPSPNKIKLKKKLKKLTILHHLLVIMMLFDKEVNFLILSS